MSTAQTTPDLDRAAARLLLPPVREVDQETVSTLVHGQPCLVAVPLIPDDAGPQLREGLQRRRDAAITGTCACGASRGPAVPTGNRAQRRQARRAGATLTWTPFPHTPDCPAHEDLLGPVLLDWMRGPTC